MESRRIRIRPARESDLDEIIAINIECLPEHYPISFWLEHMYRWGKAFYVAEVNDVVVGYVMCRVEQGVGYLKHVTRRLGHVVSVAVREGFRRLGLATMMMLASMTALRDEYGVEEVYLEVRVSNVAAIKLYEKLGFKIVRKLESYYLDGEDAYLMAKDIGESLDPIKVPPLL
ncbi:MAG: GNAT family N-acetyltransferase [Crenarchaeota archaeon]|nr:GNAT family N-acetyltransferase [Thermoproteota archaeon]